MAEGFRRRFLDPADPGDRPGLVPGSRELAASYPRYSRDNSNPRSLDPQLRLQLERAARGCRFLPWPYVFADAAVTGNTADRRATSWPNLHSPGTGSESSKSTRSAVSAGTPSR